MNTEPTARVFVGVDLTAGQRQITYVILDNGGYRIIKQRLKSFHGNENFIGMDFVDPAIDFVELAQSMGVPAQSVTEPGAVRPALEAAMASNGPTLLDVVVDRSV